MESIHAQVPRSYAPEFRQQLIELVRADRSPEQFGCPAQSIRNWVAQATIDEGKPLLGKAVLPRLSARNLRVCVVRTGRSAISSQTLRPGSPASTAALRTREREPGQLAGAAAMSNARCIGERLLRVQQRPPSKRAIEDRVLTQRIPAIHAAPDETYASPNIHAELRDEGTRVCRKHVARLMRQAAIHGVSRRRGFVVTTRRDRNAMAETASRASSASSSTGAASKQRPRLGSRSSRPSRAGTIRGAGIRRLAASLRQASKGITSLNCPRSCDPSYPHSPLGTPAAKHPRKRGTPTPIIKNRQDAVAVLDRVTPPRESTPG